MSDKFLRHPKIMKKLLVFPILLITYLAVGQVGIGTTSPNPDAVLDISSTTSGLLLPRLALTNTNNPSPLTTDVSGMVVYNTAIAGDVTPGFYVNDGIDWIRLGSTSNSDWSLTGNAGTTAGINFIGTTDAQDLYLYTNNNEQLRITTGGHARITTTTSDNNPSFAWQGDVNTGMRRLGADQLALVAGGTNLVELTETGTGNEVKINPGTTVDTDLKLESMSNSDLFLVSGVNNQVSINTPTPTAGDFFSVTGDYAINAYSNGNDETSIYADASGDTAVSVYGYAPGTAAVGIVGVGEVTSAIVPPEGAGGAFTGQDIGMAAYRFSNVNTNNEGGAYIVGKMDTGTLVANQYSYVSARIGGTWYKINGTGSVATIVDTPEGGRVNMFCPEAPEILFEDHGQGKLVNGEATIVLDSIFTHNIIVNEKHPLRVYVQLEGDCNGVYVTDKSLKGFSVKELAKGKSNVAFSYQVVANRKDELAKDGTVNSKNADVRFPKAATPMKQKKIASKKYRN